MISEIINAISCKLSESFGNSYEIYGDQTVTQAFAPPCFFISLSDCSKHNMIGGRYSLRCLFDIKFSPKNKNDIDDMFTVACSLFSALEYITLNQSETLHGTAMRYQTKEGVLHFYVNYDIFKQADLQADYMENQAYISGIGGI